MFDLDHLAAFDRALSRIAPPVSSPARAPTGCTERTAEEVVLRCTMIDRLGVEPMCPFARVEAA